MQKISCELFEGNIGLYNIFNKKFDLGGMSPDKFDIKKTEGCFPGCVLFLSIVK